MTTIGLIGIAIVGAIAVAAAGAKKPAPKEVPVRVRRR